jgi:hypothetical protein
MSTPDFLLLPIAVDGSGNAIAGNGSPTRVDRMLGHTLQIRGTFSATLVIDVSNDMIAWVPATGNLTTPQLLTIAGSFRYIRVRTAAYTSGTPTVHYAGFDQRGF